jgi:uncharacterized protein (TIGR04562 family)
LTDRANYKYWKIMERPEYFTNYRFNWETFDIIASGKSSIDAKNYLSFFDGKDSAAKFLDGYGFDVKDPIQSAELFGNFQEAMQFIRRYFLKEGFEDGLDVVVPNIFYTITDISELLLIATGNSDSKITVEESLWAGIILKVMHTILHTDKDLRYRYFSTIQTQIFDRFYKYVHRDQDDNLFLESEDKSIKIPLVEFETKSRKTRESTIIKLLHKKENVAEELFDRIGVRFVTKNKVDVLRVINFLVHNYLIIANNIKPSRSQNSLFDLDKFKKSYYEIVKNKKNDNLTEDQLVKQLEEVAKNSLYNSSEYNNNEHTSHEYRAIHFTCRQLIKYRNPFIKQFNEIRDLAKEEESELSKKLLALDTSPIAQDVRFFYPYEVQITDIDSHNENTDGEASHQEYKKSQLHSAMIRLFSPLIEYLDLKIS